jgi:hypothetical protein
MLKSVPQYYNLGEIEGFCGFYVLRVVLRGRYGGCTTGVLHVLRQGPMAKSKWALG